MFNYRLFKYSSLSEDINYFYNALRSESIDSEDLLDEYLDKVLSKSAMSESAQQRAIDNLGILFKNPQIVPMIDELLELFSHYNLNVKSVYDLNNKWSKLGQSIEEVINSKKDYSKAVEINIAKNALMNYELYEQLRGNQEEIDRFNNLYNFGGNLSLEEVNQKLAELEPKVSYYKQLISDYDAHLKQIESEHILPSFNHSISDLKNVGNKCLSIIREIGTKLDRSIDVDDWLKFITSTVKYLKPLFNKVIIDKKLEEPIIEEPSLNEDMVRILQLDKNEFIDEYLKLSNLENLRENYIFIKKLGELWAYHQKDPQFINKLNEFENINLNGKRVDFDEISKFIKSYKPFNLKDGPSGRSVFWYYDTLDKVKVGGILQTDYAEALSYFNDMSNGLISKDDRYDSMVEKYKTFKSLNTKLRNFEKWWEKRGNNPTEYGVSIRELFEIYYKIKTDFEYVPIDTISKLPEYFNDTKFKKLFDEKCNYNSSEKLELLLENFIAGNIAGRVKILSNNSPQNFIKLIKSKYPDLLVIMEENNFSLQDIEHFNMSNIMQKIIKSLDISDRELRKVPSKYFNEFNLNNSSNEERKLFDNFEKLDLYPVPASQTKNIVMQSEGKVRGFRIDFLLPCNVRKYDNDGNFTLQDDVIFVGEYFGYYGSDYEAKKKQKIEWQNALESSVNQRCLHIEPGSDLCSILKDKKIDCKCYPDYVSSDFNINDEHNKKILFVRSQLHNFVYTYLINELLWRVGYDYSKLSNDNLESLKARNKEFLDKFDHLLSNCDSYSINEITKECFNILYRYDIRFKREQKGVKPYNNRLRNN